MRPFSFSLGVLFEGVHRAQIFDASAADVDDRSSWGFAFGVLGAAEVPLFAGVGLRLEGGPLTHALRVARTDNGAEVSDAVEGWLSWWGAAGLGVRF